MRHLMFLSLAMLLFRSPGDSSEGGEASGGTPGGPAPGSEGQGGAIIPPRPAGHPAPDAFQGAGVDAASPDNPHIGPLPDQHTEGVQGPGPDTSIKAGPGTDTAGAQIPGQNTEDGKVPGAVQDGPDSGLQQESGADQQAGGSKLKTTTEVETGGEKVTKTTERSIGGLPESDERDVTKDPAVADKAGYNKKSGK